MNASTAYTACGILAGITIASPALHWYFTPPTVNSPTPSRTVTMASPVESCVPISSPLSKANRVQGYADCVVLCKGLADYLVWHDLDFSCEVYYFFMFDVFDI